MPPHVQTTVPIPSPAHCVAAVGTRLAVSVTLPADDDGGYVAVFDKIDMRKVRVWGGGGNGGMGGGGWGEGAMTWAPNWPGNSHAAI